MKKLWSFMLAIILVFTIVSIGIFSVSAGSYESLTEAAFIEKISQVKSQYPDGKYWNLYNGKDAEGIALAGNQICPGYNHVSGKSCVTEGYCGIRSNDGCTCNCGRFHGWQCHGFANLMAYKIMGSYAITTTGNSSGLNSSKGWTYSTSVSEYYAGLIAFRKAHPALRMTSAEEVASHITMLSGLDFNVVGCHISAGANGEANELVVIYNPNAAETVVTLPEGKWSVYVNGETAGTEVLDTVKGQVTVAGASAMALVKESSGGMSIGIIGGADGPTSVFVTGSAVPVIAGAAVVVLAAIVIILIKKRKK